MVKLLKKMKIFGTRDSLLSLNLPRMVTLDQETRVRIKVEIHLILISTREALTKEVRMANKNNKKKRKRPIKMGILIVKKSAMQSKTIVRIKK